MSMHQHGSKTGTLFIVATPIGNLQDISQRAVEVLRAVPLLAVEDTRHSRKLMNQFGISTSMVSVHEHNERERIDRLLGHLQSGGDLALISDAGTPLISDPGFVLVRAARAAGIRVVPVPGACALVAALSVSGLPTNRFRFEGFLPPRAAARRERLLALAAEPATLVFYESSHRIVESLRDMADCLGGVRTCTVARELTKTFETVESGPLEVLCEWVSADENQQKGEFVVMVHGAETDPAVLDAASCHTLQVLLEELPLKQAAALAAKLTGQSKNRLYDYGLSLKKP
jgi:16S rRNA (cytidine1402-2'-O)-methyltransferase